MTPPAMVDTEGKRGNIEKQKSKMRTLRSPTTFLSSRPGLLESRRNRRDSDGSDDRDGEVVTPRKESAV